MKAILMIESLYWSTENHPNVEIPGGNICKDVNFPELPQVGQTITLGLAEDILNDTDLDGHKIAQVFWRQIATETTLVPIILLEKWCLGSEEDWQTRSGKEKEPNEAELLHDLLKFFKESLEPLGFYVMTQERCAVSHYGSPKKYGAELKRLGLAT